MKVGDIYPTRDGRQAKVISLEGGNTARIEVLPKPEIHWIFQDGRGHAVHECPFDLILPKPYRVRRVLTYEGPQERVEQYLIDCNKGRAAYEANYGIKINIESRQEF
jgi:hypothetical protein